MTARAIVLLAAAMSVFLTGCNNRVSIPSQITSPEAFPRLAAECQESRTALAGELQAAQNDLQKNGVEESYETLESDLATSAAPAAPTDCRGVIAAYLVLREPQ